MSADVLEAIGLVSRFDFGNGISVVVYSCDGGGSDFNVNAPGQTARKCGSLEEAILLGADLFRDLINNNCESEG